MDADGWTDVYVTALGGNKLYLNNHDGTFRESAGTAGVVVGGWSTGCGFADYDRDGDLDLFVSRYVKIDLENLPEFGKGKTCEYRGVAVQCGPRGLPGEGDVLFRNEGNGRFTDVSTAAGVSDPRAYFGLGVAWVDTNEDGWPDLYVANDSTASFLYINQKDGTFKESGFPLGVAVSEDGAEQGGMGLAVGDYDNSGRFSIFKTNFSEEYNNLFRNEGTYFTDMAFRSRTAASSLPFVGWGTAFLDYDNDGWLDIIVVNGHVYPQLDNARLGASAPYRQRRLLYHNRGDGTFDEVAAQYGEVLTQPRVQRGLALGDLDDDGRLDVVINDLDGAPQVLHNELPATGNWLTVKVRGKGKNLDALGAVVSVKAGRLSLRRLVQSGTSYISQDDMRQHFGLGAADAGGRRGGPVARRHRDPPGQRQGQPDPGDPPARALATDFYFADVGTLVCSATTATYSWMADRMFSSASASSWPCDQQPGSPGTDAATPSSDRCRTTLYFIRQPPDRTALESGPSNTNFSDEGLNLRRYVEHRDQGRVPRRFAFADLVCRIRLFGSAVRRFGALAALRTLRRASLTAAAVGNA